MGRRPPRLPRTDPLCPYPPLFRPGLVAPNVAAANAPAAFSPLSEDGRVGILSFEWDVDSPADLEVTTVEELEELLAETTDEGLVAEDRKSTRLNSSH